jgi:hypothetical protein
MGQAFDDKGHVLGDAYGDTKRDVFEQLNKAHPEAHEIRIKALSDRAGAIQAQGASTPMPSYRSHKKVWALKIAAVAYDKDAALADGNRETDGSAVLTPAEAPYAPFIVNAEYVRKHNPQAGGYFVQYEDGYKSFSPAEAFESGYTRL